jgi:mono/diheme cytochrome c family protein
VDSVADIGQHEVSPAVGGELLGSCCLDQHGQGADGEQDGRNRSRENCHACHAEDATEDKPRVASGQIPNLRMGLMGESPYAVPLSMRLRTT